MSNHDCRKASRLILGKAFSYDTMALLPTIATISEAIEKMEGIERSRSRVQRVEVCYTHCFC